MPKMNNTDWLEFEEAVAQFVTAIGGDAKVTHDALIPDAHTGRPRQRDVWVEWSVAGHYPTKALISCKHWKNPLDQSDIDHFNGEFISSEAHVGIIYALSGFNKHAIEKAKKLRFHCCKLYRNQPADLPSVLLIENIYHLRPACTVSTRGLKANCTFTHWKELLSLPVGDSTVLETLADAIDRFQRPASAKEVWRKVRDGHDETVSAEQPGSAPFAITVHCFYRIYVAKIEYTMLNGSYNITHGGFVGRQGFPIIDTKSANPGPGWELVESVPEDIPTNYVAIFALGDWKRDLTAFGEKRFPSKIEATLSDNSPPSIIQICETSTKQP